MTSGEQNIQEFTLGALQAAGAAVVVTAEGAFHVKTLPSDLQRILQRSSLHFTFDEEYFDVHRDAGVEFVAPGYPLLDALIRLTRARFTVSEAVVPAAGGTAHLLGSASPQLELKSARQARYRPYLRFRIRVIYQSDAYHETIVSITVDPSTGQTLPPGSGDWPLTAVTAIQEKNIAPPKEDLIQAAWSTVEREIQVLVSQEIARHEDLANIRLYREKTNLERFLQQQQTLQTPRGQAQIQELIDRYRLTVKLDLIFAELIHYPVEVIKVAATRKHPRTGAPWSARFSYEVDRVTGRIDKRPTCPVCQSPLSVVAPCDGGGHLLCTVCSTQCTTCSAHHCQDHPLTACHVQGCGNGHCQECLGNCSRCRHGVCTDSCSLSCPECHDSVCLDCTQRCSCCEHTACAVHFEQCHLTQSALCSSHAPRCQSCGLATHPAHVHDIMRTSGVQETLCDNCAAPCAVSGDLHHPDDLYRCHETNRKISAASSYVCPCCRHLVATDVVTVTAEGESLCPSCIGHCAACSAPHRLQLLAVCAGAHSTPHLLCSEHRISCQDCAGPTSYCAAHVKTCTDCGMSVCADHALVSALSHRVVCRRHETGCSDCGRRVAHSELKTVPTADRTSTREVCSACTDHCVACAPGSTLYAKSMITVCSHGDRNTHRFCSEHLNTCEICTEPACDSHSAVCSDCGRMACADHIQTTRTGLKVCRDCVGRCRHCSPQEAYSLKHMQVCVTCQTPYCDTHVRQCAECKGYHCPDHLHKTASSLLVCKKHVAQCTRCTNVVGRSELGTCVGGEQTCRSCLTRCDSCLKPHCATHTRKCRLCEQSFCSSCATEFCRHCNRLSEPSSDARSSDHSWAQQYFQQMVALGLALPTGKVSMIKTVQYQKRIHLLYTPPPKGLLNMLGSMFVKPAQRIAVVEVLNGGQLKLLNDREVPAT